MQAKESIGMTDDMKKDIKKLFCEIFETNDLKEIPVSDMLSTLKHD